MKLEPRIKTLILGLLGVALTIAYFWLLARTHSAEILALGKSRGDILWQAEQAFQESELSEYALRRQLEFSLNDKLYRYAQSAEQPIGPGVQPKVASWQVSWDGKVKTDGADKEMNARFRVRYDLNGRLVAINKDSPVPLSKESLSEAEALNEAKLHLSIFEVDTSRIRVTKKTASERDSVSSFQFTFSQQIGGQDHLKASYSVEITGDVLTSYSSSIRVDEDIFTFPKIDEISVIVGGVLAAITWVVIGVFLLVIFVRRLRHDELDFKRAAWAGGVVAVVMWIMVGLNSRSDWTGILLGGGFAGLFTGLGMLVTVAGMESLTRDSWPEKLVVSDLLFRGNLRFRELGMAILNAFFITGMTLAVFGATVWIATNYGLGYLEFDSDSFWIYQGMFETAAALCENIVEAAFVGVIVLFFWGSYLRSRIEKKTTLIFLLGLTYLLSGMHLGLLRPTYVSLPLLIPVAMLLAYFVFKHDFVTLFLALFGFGYVQNFSLVGLSTDSLSGPAVVLTSVLATGIFVAGVALIFLKSSVKDFQHYVPEYVSRIAERERLLKELEIARTVQMKFLPQQLPNFPKLDIASICRPAMEVGGDYYDFLAQGDNHLSVLIGDVSGKGVSAAFYMTMTSGIVRTLSKRINSPKTILTELNEVFYEYTPREVFISVIYGLFDMEKKTLTFARAGHNPVMGWKNVGGETQILDSKGIAVGLEHGKVFSSTIEEKTIPVDSGDLFVFYTDGISEAMNHHADEFGEERLRDIITAHAHGSAQVFLDTVTNEVSTFVGEAEQHDDLTMVVVKVS